MKNPLVDLLILTCNFSELIYQICLYHHMYCIDPKYLVSPSLFYILGTQCCTFSCNMHVQLCTDPFACRHTCRSLMGSQPPQVNFLSKIDFGCVQVIIDSKPFFQDMQSRCQTLLCIPSARSEQQSFSDAGTVMLPQMFTLNGTFAIIANNLLGTYCSNTTPYMLVYTVRVNRRSKKRSLWERFWQVHVKKKTFPAHVIQNLD